MEKISCTKMAETVRDAVASFLRLPYTVTLLSRDEVRNAQSQLDKLSNILEQYTQLIWGAYDPRFLSSMEHKKNYESKRLWAHVGRVNDLKVLDDGRIVSGYLDGSISVWTLDSQTGEYHEKKITEHIGQITAFALLGSDRMVSASFDGYLIVWDTTGDTVEKIAVIQAHLGGVSFLQILPDERIVSAGYDDTITIWQKKGTEYEEAYTLSGHEKDINMVQVLPDGRVVSASLDGTVRMWTLDTSSDTYIFEVLLDTNGFDDDGEVHVDDIISIHVALNGDIVAGGQDHIVYVLRKETGTNAYTKISFEAHGDWIDSVQWLPGGRILTGSFDGLICIWEWNNQLKKYEEIETLMPDGKVEKNPVVLGDGRIISASETGAVFIWDGVPALPHF